MEKNVVNDLYFLLIKINEWAINDDDNFPFFLQLLRLQLQEECFL